MVEINKRYTFYRGVIFFMASFVFSSMGLFYVIANEMINGGLLILTGIFLLIFGLSRLKEVSITENEIRINDFFYKKAVRIYNWSEVKKFKILIETLESPDQLVLWLEKESVRIKIRPWEVDKLKRLVKKNKIIKNKNFFFW